MGFSVMKKSLMILFVKHFFYRHQLKCSYFYEKTKFNYSRVYVTRFLNECLITSVCVITNTPLCFSAVV